MKIITVKVSDDAHLRFCEASKKSGIRREKLAEVAIEKEVKIILEKP